MNHPDLLGGEGLKLVGVVPPLAFQRRSRLWRALEEAFPVSFQARQSDQLVDLDAVISHGVDVQTAAAIPTLRTYAEESATGPARIRLTKAPGLGRCLEGQEFGDEWAREPPSLRVDASETVLAERDGLAMWVTDRQTGTQHRSALLPTGLGEQEALRDRLGAGRFLALLPIVSLLRGLTKESSWKPPPLRATFMFDDPNLHWRSYGYLDFADLARRAKQERFHVALATVPLDGWFANRTAVRLFHEHRRLSLLVHGNDHAWCELGEAVTEDASLAITAQALRRIGSLERRTGIPVSRVMAPPHGRCSFETFQALRRTGFIAACVSRPYPWLERPPADRPLAQWDIADVVACLPVLSRYSLTMSREDIPFRAFLHQPLILYGHNDDLSGGASLLDDLAAEVNRMGEVRWCDLTSIARSSVLIRRDGDLLRVRMYTREAEIEVPEGVRKLAVELPEQGGASTDSESLLVTSSACPARMAKLNEPFELAAGARSWRVRLVSSDAVDIARVPVPRWRLWPRARRLLVEGRDRLAPAVGSVGVGRGPSRGR